MSDPAVNLDRLFELVATVCDEDATRDEIVELNSIMLADREACRRYQRYCRMHSALRVELRAHQAAQAVCRQIGIAPVVAEADEAHVTTAMRPAPAFTAPFLPTALHGTTTFFSSGWPAAYLAATVICGIGILVGSLVHVSRPVNIARHAPSVAADNAVLESQPMAVGRITGMADCRFDRATGTPGTKTQVFVGDKLILSAGLLEITYDKGAKVILQGPVTYEVESAVGGFLSLGKLTARLESRSRLPSGTVSAESRPAGGTYLFVVRTPTATVTDLGTEFGVEVSKEGATTSHVFRGSVRLQVPASGANQGSGNIVLHENESVRTEKVAGRSSSSVVIRRVSVLPQTFIRRVTPAAKVIDLLDIVAGGDGFGRHRERGIDPATGMEDGLFVAARHDGDGRYRPVPLQKLIDGVFIPDGRRQPITLDSAGHTFDGFRPTSGASYGLIWARAVEPPADSEMRADRYWVYRLGRGEQFAPHRRGLLCMHTNAGITFNLEAMRELHPGSRPARFRTLAGVPKVNSVIYTADFGAGNEGWEEGGSVRYWHPTGGQDGGYVGAIRDGLTPYLTPPQDSILYGDLGANFGTPLLTFSYYLKNFAGWPREGARLYMFANGGSGAEDTLWEWMPADMSVPRDWRRYTWTVDTAASTAPAGWTRVRGSAAWAESWKHVRYWNFWSAGGGGQINNGIDTVMVSGVEPAQDAGTGQVADIWVFVDGRLRLKRQQLRPRDGVVPVDVAIAAHDQFLTLAATDGGNGAALAGVVFGDPALYSGSSDRD